MKELIDTPTDPCKILVARKWSGIEYDMFTKNLTFDQSLALHDYDGLKQKYLSAHNAQRDSFKKLLELINKDMRVVEGIRLTRELVRPYKEVIVLGGDNYFQYVSHFVDKQIILGINSDPDRSIGAMLKYHPDNMEEILQKLFKGGYEIEEWTRLHATIERANGKIFDVQTLASSEIFVGDIWSIGMTRQIDPIEVHRGSGGLFSTAAGLTGWYNSAGGHLKHPQRGFSKTDKIGWYYPRERYLIELIEKVEQLPDPLLFYKGEKITITYTSYDEGEVSIDPKRGSRRNYKIRQGDKVHVEISDKPLRVVV